MSASALGGSKTPSSSKTKQVMLHSLLALKLAAMAAALGLDTSEWNSPSPEISAQVQALENLQKAAAEGNPAPEGNTLQDVVNKIKDLADKGDKDAQFSMGLFLQQSNQQGALQQALDYYDKAAKQGQLQAMNNYGFIVAASTQDPAQAKLGVEKIKEASTKGLNAARRNMATIYLRGMAGEPRNVPEAKKLLEAAVADPKQPDYQAEFELAQFYLGAGGPENQDTEKAWELLNSAAKHGNPNALAALGSVLFDGKEFGTEEKKKKIPADPKGAVDLFKKLAEQNNPAGLRTMGELYQKGIPNTGVEKDFKKALEYYGKAAQGNDAVAQVILAGFYDRGFDENNDKTLEVAPNPAASLELYRLAAQNNVPLAFYNIGAFYEAGRAVDKDMTKAFGYFLQAAVNGFGPAMQKVGVYYLNGAGILKDPVAATGWFTRSAASNVPEGLVSLGVMAENGLVPPTDPNDTQFQTAVKLYGAVEDNVAASDPVRMEALLRLGNLYFRGVTGPATQKEAKPDFERAYGYFKLASDLDPNNKLAAQAKEQAEKPLTVEQKASAAKMVEVMKKKREDKVKAAAAAAAPTTGAPVGAAPAPPTPASPAPAPSTKKKTK
jgi:TPR repeat protein